jgi:SOS response regulatory protein OraA/RecX
MKIRLSKNKKNVQLFLEEEFIGEIPIKLLPQEIYLNLNMTTQNELTQEFHTNFNTLNEESEFCDFVENWVTDNAKRKLLDYLAKAEKTIYDCKIFLNRRNIPMKIVKTILNEFQQKKWISDERYTSIFIEDSIIFEKSPAEIKQKLFQKKINPSIINSYLNQVYTKDKKIDTINNLIDKKIKSFQFKDKPEKNNSPQHNLFNKIATILYRKGFQYEDYCDILTDKINKYQKTNT